MITHTDTYFTYKPLQVCNLLKELSLHMKGSYFSPEEKIIERTQLLSFPKKQTFNIKKKILMKINI